MIVFLRPVMAIAALIVVALTPTWAKAIEPDFRVDCKIVYVNEGNRLNILESALALPLNDKRRVTLYAQQFKIPTSNVFSVEGTCDRSTYLTYSLAVMLKSVLAIELLQANIDKEHDASALDADFILDYGLSVEPYVSDGGVVKPENFRAYLAVARDGLIYFHEPIRCAREFAMLQRWLPNDTLPDLHEALGGCPAA